MDIDDETLTQISSDLEYLKGYKSALYNISNDDIENLKRSYAVSHIITNLDDEGIGIAGLNIKINDKWAEFEITPDGYVEGVSVPIKEADEFIHQYLELYQMPQRYMYDEACKLGYDAKIESEWGIILICKHFIISLPLDPDVQFYGMEWNTKEQFLNTCYRELAEIGRDLNIFNLEQSKNIDLYRKLENFLFEQ